MPVAGLAELSPASQTLLPFESSRNAIASQIGFKFIDRLPEYLQRRRGINLRRIANLSQPNRILIRVRETQIAGTEHDRLDFIAIKKAGVQCGGRIEEFGVSFGHLTMGGGRRGNQRGIFERLGCRCNRSTRELPLLLLPFRTCTIAEHQLRVSGAALSVVSAPASETRSHAFITSGQRWGDRCK